MCPSHGRSAAVGSDVARWNILVLCVQAVVTVLGLFQQLHSFPFLLALLQTSSGLVCSASLPAAPQVLLSEWKLQHSFPVIWNTCSNRGAQRFCSPVLSLRPASSVCRGCPSPRGLKMASERWLWQRFSGLRTFPPAPAPLLPRLCATRGGPFQFPTLQFSRARSRALGKEPENGVCGAVRVRLPDVLSRCTSPALAAANLLEILVDSFLSA